MLMLSLTDSIVTAWTFFFVSPRHSTIAGKKKTTPWEKKMEQRRKQDSIKQREREMKAEKESETERYASILCSCENSLTNLNSSWGRSVYGEHQRLTHVQSHCALTC